MGRLVVIVVDAEPAIFQWIERLTSQKCPLVAVVDYVVVVLLRLVLTFLDRAPGKSLSVRTSQLTLTSH